MSAVIGVIVSAPRSLRVTLYPVAPVTWGHLSVTPPGMIDEAVAAGPAVVHSLVVSFVPPPVVLPAMMELVPAGTVPPLAMSGGGADGVTGGGGGVCDTVGVIGLTIVAVVVCGVCDAGGVRDSVGLPPLTIAAVVVGECVVFRLLSSTASRVKFQVQVSVVCALDGGCHAYDDTTPFVRVPLIVFALALSSM